MPESGRSRNVRGLTASELERIRRELRASLALARPNSLARVPILAQLSAIDAELAERAQAAPDIMKLTPDQLATIGQLSDQWSFLWDKRRSLWIAAEDCPDGEQIEDADLDVLLARLPDCSRSLRAVSSPAAMTTATAVLTAMDSAGINGSTADTSSH
jgi:hypothetical protein